MNRQVKIYVGLLLLILIGTIAYDSTQPKPINWTPTYSVTDKIPFGLYVFDHEIDQLLKGRKLTRHNVTPYEYLESLYDYDSLVNDYKVKGCIFNINQYSNLDSESVKEICYFVSHGNSAFLSARVLPDELLDSLHVEMDADFKYSDSIFNWVANPKLGSNKYNILEGVGNNYFAKIDSTNTTVLGYQSGDSTRVNFIKVQYKNGEVFLHTQPTAFTNFHLLKKDHYQYAEKVLSYVPQGNVFWFRKQQDGEVISDSPLRYITSQPALKWAWYLFLLGMLVFILFNAKRKQRVVPIISPLGNTTIDFTKSIGNLYFQEGDHDNIINKKIIYFLEKIRNEYLIDTTKLDDEFVKKLHLKSGKELHDIKQAVFLINTHRRSPHNSVAEDLIQINNAIEKIL
ncbi:MAG TPA: DUF4350 domain-containing protein [Flavobacterium sp.]|nr:DUF4350 domain-containing protein [Flavobacterium sp.]HPJ09450.1 DUF4350 domain-containing protein [Flavobacterium sp.]